MTVILVMEIEGRTQLSSDDSACSNTCLYDDVKPLQFSHSIMPFGLCLQDLAMQPCPHHLACFSATCGSVRGPCEHLVVDKNDDNQRAGLEEEKLRAIAMIDLLQEDEELCSSPQLDHFRTVLASVSGFLGEVADEQ